MILGANSLGWSALGLPGDADIPDPGPPAPTPGRAVIDWGAAISVSIGGADRTGDLVGAGEVDRELDAAGIATLRLRGAMPGVGDAVVVAGVCATPFVGSVDSVAYDPALRGWVVSATDGLQAVFEGLATPEAVLALLPPSAIWMEALFGEFHDGWECARDAMSTVPYSIYMEGGALRQVAWAGGGYTREIAHAVGGIYDGSLSLVVASGRELVREVRATVQIRYSRWHWWQIHVGWTAPEWDFVDWLHAGYSLPTRQVVQDCLSAQPWALASSSSGLSASSGLPSELRGIAVEGLPKSGVYGGSVWSIVDPVGVVWINECADPLTEMCSSWSAKLNRRWVQTVTETVSLTVAGTAATAGAVETEQASLDIDADDSAYEGGAGQLGPSIYDTTWTRAAYGGAHAWRDNGSDDLREMLLRGMMGLAATRIRASVRGTQLSARTEPGVEPALGSRCRIAGEDVGGVGQVVRLRTAWDIDSADIGCVVTIAISSGSVAGDASQPPSAAPDTVAPLPASIVLDTHIGRVSGAPVQDEEWTNCWAGNAYTIPVTSAPVYDEGLKLTTPDVPDAMRDELALETDWYVDIDPMIGSVEYTP